ncbi:hypothetical protein H9P43_006039 [Blastocladiella emersonii ATCC 22665]|nr:hypothetical protein H9P43_006039 [Blastocladiella emersonii ATCC 22665]
MHDMAGDRERQASDVQRMVGIAQAVAHAVVSAALTAPEATANPSVVSEIARQAAAIPGIGTPQAAAVDLRVADPAYGVEHPKAGHGGQ